MTTGSIEGTFVCFLPLIVGKPFIELSLDYTDKTLIHEMVHYFLYLQYLPHFLASPQKQGDANKFRKRFQHTREFWAVLREKMTTYEKG